MGTTVMGRRLSDNERVMIANGLRLEADRLHEQSALYHARGNLTAYVQTATASCDARELADAFMPEDEPL